MEKAKGGGTGATMPDGGVGGVTGVGGVRCAIAAALVNNTIANIVSRFLIFIDRNPPDKICLFHAPDEQ
jgi:hypothetical protein